MAASMMFMLLFLLLLDLGGDRTWFQLLLLIPVLSSQSLIMLLLLGAFADNKVMGMAISKGFGILLVGPLLDYILPYPMNWAGAYSPLFWASRSLLADQASPFWLYLCITIVFHCLLLWILFRKFRARSD